MTGMEQSSALDALLAGFVAGSLPRATQALVAAHLELSPRNQPFVQALDQDFTRHAEMSQVPVLHERNARLAAILSLPREPALPVSTDAMLPGALGVFCGRPLDALDWRFVLPGIREHRFAVEEGVEASFIRIKAGRSVPAHTHGGSEITLLLKGGFTDITGHYTRGDMVIVDGDIDHKPVADMGEDCLCFAVTDAPLRLTGTFGRFFSRFLPH